jgi:hypothetical protein
VKKNISFQSCIFYLLPFIALLLFCLTYVIIEQVKKRRYLIDTIDSIAMRLLVVSIITGIILFLQVGGTNISHHFYYNPTLFSWEELPLLMILQIVSFAVTVVLTIAAIVTAFRRYKWQLAIYHALGYLSIPASVIFATIAICFLVFMTVLAIIGVFAIIMLARFIFEMALVVLNAMSK